MRKRVIRSAWALSLLAVGALLLAANAGAAFNLTPQGCISDLGDPAGCGATTQGLNGADTVAVSPDGASVYVASPIDNALVRFDRNTTTGALTPQGCFSDPVMGPPICGATAQGLDQPRDVVVSADGKSVYVAADQDAAITEFDRNTTTGALTPDSCIARFVSAGCASTTFGLNGADGVAISSDGKSVYVAGPIDDAIVRFDRNTTTGHLAAAGCIADIGAPAGCAANQQGLDGARGLGISGDGKSVYVASQMDDAIVRFDRNMTTGALTGAGCIADVGNVAGCAAVQQGLDSPLGIGLSPGDDSLYATSRVDHALVRFDRSTTTGALTPQGCIADVGDVAGCGTTQQGLNVANEAVVSPDGESVYVAAGGIDNAVTRFDRNPASGAIVPVGCIARNAALGCAATAKGLLGASGIVMSPDGKSVYVGSVGDDAIVHFDRRFALPTLPFNPLPPASEFVIRRIDHLRLILTVSAAGEVEVKDPKDGKGRGAGKPKRLLKPSAATAEAAGTVSVKLRLTRAAKRRLKDRGKLRVRAAITFTATGGEPATKTKALKLKD